MRWWRWHARSLARLGSRSHFAAAIHFTSYETKATTGPRNVLKTIRKVFAGASTYRPTFLRPHKEEPAHTNSADQKTPPCDLRDLIMSGIKNGELNVVQQMLGLREIVDKYKDIAFVCVDCEAFEFAQHKITEIGVSVLDMSDVGKLGASDASAEGFISKMQNAHYRITEHGHLVNKRWVKGHPENFIFGQSIWVNCANAKSLMENVFRNPGSLATSHQAGTTTDDGKKVVLVGHDIGNDDDYLKRLDFDLKALPNVISRVDTQRIAGSKKRSVGLSRLLKALQVDAKFMHNAGNDAAYTLQALILMAVREFHEPESVAKALANHIEQSRKKPEGVEPQPNRRERKRITRLHQQGQLEQTTEGAALEQIASAGTNFLAGSKAEETKRIGLNTPK